MDGQTAVVGQVRVVHSRPHQRGHGVLRLLGHVVDGLAKDGSRLWVDGNQTKRHLSGFFVVQKLVIRAAKPEAVELRDANTFKVVVSVALGHKNEPHHAVHRFLFFNFGVATAILGLASSSVKFGVQSVQTVQNFKRQAHCDGIADPHLAAVANNAEIAQSRGVFVDEKLLQRHTFDPNFAFFIKNSDFGVEKLDRSAVRRDDDGHGRGRHGGHDLHVFAGSDPLHFVGRNGSDIDVSDFCRVIEPEFHHAELLQHGVLHHVVECAVAV